jgi:hypothetical protein
MASTVAGPGDAEDPAVVRRQGPAAGPYAAELEELEELEEVVVDDELESDDDEEEVLDGFDAAGLLLEDEPRLSLR